MIADTRVYDKGKDTELVSFKGKVTWAQLIDPNRFGNWSINLYPDNESLERLRELQLKNVFKKDDDGWFLQISRPTSIEFQKGVQTTVTPPKVRDAEKKPIDDRVGDGSDVTVTCELRKYKVPNSERWGNSIRLYGVTVENLVPAGPARPKAEAEVETVW